MALADPHGLPLNGHTGSIEILAISADGHWLATGSADETVKVWDLQSADPGANPLTLPSEIGEIKTLAFSSDDHWLAAAGGDRAAQLWDMNNPDAGSILLDGHDSTITTLAFSPDALSGTSNRWLATGSVDQTVHLWDLTSANPSANPSVLDGPNGRNNCPGLQPGRRMAGCR